MKIVISLCLIQILLLGLLLARSMTLEPVVSPSSALSSAVSSVPGDVAIDEDVKPIATDVSSSLDEALLRQIIREELYALLEVEDPVTHEGVTNTQPRRSQQDLVSYELARDKLAQYRNVGAISEQQMYEFQSTIAKLDERSRRELLSELMRAMNSGEIKGLL